MGAVGAMLILCVLSLMWVFRRMDQRLEQTQNKADTDRTQYFNNMQQLTVRSVESHEKSTAVLDKLCTKIDSNTCKFK